MGSIAFLERSSWMVNNMRSKGILVLTMAPSGGQPSPRFFSTNSPYELRRKPRFHQTNKL
jgi:hypothetical protein